MPEFNPDYGYTLEQLLNIVPPPEPKDFAAFWQARYRRAMHTNPQPQLSPSYSCHPDFNCYDVSYSSTDAWKISGWVLTPKHSPITRGVIVGHGYGGREGPDFDLPIPGAAFLFPCFRGLARSRSQLVSDNPSYHVLHNIDKPDSYILGGCVDDLWLGVSALLDLFPATAGHVGYLGISFGGGIGAMALPWERRIQRAHLNVPSFGNQPLRLQLPTRGSAAAVQNYQKAHGNVLATLQYYDAAIAARRVTIPVHVAAALIDPVVAPPGQFSIYNALPESKKLFVLDQGHMDYVGQAEQKIQLLSELQKFFSLL